MLNNKKENKRLPMPGKVKKGFRCYCTLVMAAALLGCCSAVALELPGLTVSGERMADKVAAEQLKEACQGANVTIKKVECKEKSEKPPALYDLTTLQRHANRLLGFTAQQTLDYLQSLYEKKLCTYPRTDVYKRQHQSRQAPSGAY